jgi:hypothetical protein
MTYEEASIQLQAADTEYDAASLRYRNAERALKRSRSKKNVAEFIAARDALWPLAEACRTARDRMERAATVAHRLAVTAPRRALREAQASLF